MSGALGRWRDRVAQQLRDSGLNVVTAMDPGRAARWREPVAAAAVSQVVCAPGGFQDYLGVERDGQTGEEREVYGREAELTLALDIFAPRDGGGEACRKAAETAVEVRTGRTEFLERDGLYRLEVACRCRAWLTARADQEAGAFTDFEVKGRMR